MPTMIFKFKLIFYIARNYEIYCSENDRYLWEVNRQFSNYSFYFFYNAIFDEINPLIGDKFDRWRDFALDIIQHLLKLVLWHLFYFDFCSQQLVTIHLRIVFHYIMMQF